MWWEEDSSDRRAGGAAPPRPPKGTARPGRFLPGEKDLARGNDQRFVSPRTPLHSRLSFLSEVHSRRTAGGGIGGGRRTLQKGQRPGGGDESGGVNGR